MTTSSINLTAAFPKKFKFSWSDKWAFRATLILSVLVLLIIVVAPMSTVLVKSLQNQQGVWVGLENFSQYLSNAHLQQSLINTLIMGVSITSIVVLLAFSFAYALTHTAMPLKTGAKFLATLPILAPSLLPAIALVYLFGNQGVFKAWLLGESIYGPIGIILGSIFWIFPHTFIILYTALSQNDGRLYEAANSLKTGFWRTFFQVTLPNCKYGLLSAVFVTFTLVITDFGVPKVIGGNFNVLATDIYKQVIGQQNFSMGSVVGVILLLPAILSFLADRYVQKKQNASLTSKSTAYHPHKNTLLDVGASALVLLVLSFVILIISTAVYASFVTFWPYNLSLSLNNYQFDMMDGGGWQSFINSLKMASLTAVIGTALIFMTAWLSLRSPYLHWVKKLIHIIGLIPMAVPGMVLGLSYIFFFNHPENPLNSLYGTLAILVLCTIAHFYTVGHLTAMTAFKQIDVEFDQVSDSLKLSRFTTFFKVLEPMALPSISQIFIYLFINAMTTVSAVVFLYSSKTPLASVAVLNMDDAGDIAPAAAMASLIMLSCFVAKFLHWFFIEKLLIGKQRWR